MRPAKRFDHAARALGALPELESDLQRSASDLLQMLAPWGAKRSTFLWHSIPNEGNRGKGQTGRLRGMGMRPGVADLLLAGRDGTLYIELKTRTGRLSPAQEAFRDACEHQGVGYAVCRSLGELAATLVAYGFVGPEVLEKLG